VVWSSCLSGLGRYGKYGVILLFINLSWSCRCPVSLHYCKQFDNIVASKYFICFIVDIHVLTTKWLGPADGILVWPTSAQINYSCIRSREVMWVYKLQLEQGYTTWKPYGFLFIKVSKKFDHAKNVEIFYSQTSIDNDKSRGGRAFHRCRSLLK